MGTVTPEFLEGDLFLTDADGRNWRLTWSGDEDGTQRARALPAGTYQLKTYRIVRYEAGERWHVSATSLGIAELDVIAGEELLVELDDAIVLRSSLSRKRAQLKFEGAAEAGLTIYRDGARIPVDYRLLAANGALLSAGPMEYG